MGWSEDSFLSCLKIFLFLERRMKKKFISHIFLKKGLDENEGGIQYPTNFRIMDVFQTAVEMGATVVRAHTLGISTGNEKSFEITLNDFQDAAVERIHFAIYAAKKAQIRLIIPLTDNYHYYHGGKHDFTDWRGVDENQFYSDSDVISDFENYISMLLLSYNNYTGLQLIDDPTIMIWETGNELIAPANWTRSFSFPFFKFCFFNSFQLSSLSLPLSTTQSLSLFCLLFSLRHIARFIKSLDSNHLVQDGTNLVVISDESLKNEEVDVFTDHFYPMSVDRLNADMKRMKDIDRVFYIGEYGWDTGDLPSFLEAIQENGNVTGDLYWSLFPHADSYGYVQHGDGYTLHYPGDTDLMQEQAQQLRTHAFNMSQLFDPPHLVPPSPLITLLNSTAIAWRGAANSQNYQIEGCNPSDGQQQEEKCDYEIVCDRCVTDDDLPWQLPQGTGFVRYRARGFSLDGQPGPWSQPAHVQN